MKLQTLLLATFFTGALKAQVLVSQTPGTAHPSAVLEARSQNKGFLPPVMSTQQRRAIPNPAYGLMVYDTTRHKMYAYTDLGWRPFLMGFDYDSILISSPSSPTNPNYPNKGELGTRVAMAGNYAAGGAWSDDINGANDRGSVFLYHLNEGGEWSLETKILAPDGAAGDYFGWFVAMDSQYLFVGAPLADVNGVTDQGAVYVYQLTNGAFSFLQKLTGSTSAFGDHFGDGLGLSGSDLLVGSPWDQIGSNTRQGSAYYFARQGNSWVQKQKLISPDGQSFDNFGGGFSIDDNYLTIGATSEQVPNYGYSQNATYLLKKDEDGFWAFQQKILQPNTASKYQGFGWANSLKNNTLITGAWLEDEPSGNKDRGSAFVFSRSQTNQPFTFKTKVAPPDAAPGSPGNQYGDYYGFAIHRHNNLVLIGAPYEDHGSGQYDFGSAYLYELQADNTLRQIQEIKSPTPGFLNAFGNSVAMNSEWIMIGEPRVNGNLGSVHFYKIIID